MCVIEIVIVINCYPNCSKLLKETYQTKKKRHCQGQALAVLIWHEVVRYLYLEAGRLRELDIELKGERVWAEADWKIIFLVP